MKGAAIAINGLKLEEGAFRELPGVLGEGMSRRELAAVDLVVLLVEPLKQEHEEQTARDARQTERKDARWARGTRAGPRKAGEDKEFAALTRRLSIELFMDWLVELIC